MDDTTPDSMARALREQGGRYVVDAQNHPVAVLLTLEEYEHYLDLLDDEADSQDDDLATRLTQAAAATGDRRTSLRAYLHRRPSNHADVPS
jgi:PHD/YefM family antitoxin component YafN of YafNO toxin-antitoxin module